MFQPQVWAQPCRLMVLEQNVCAWLWAGRVEGEGHTTHTNGCVSFLLAVREALLERSRSGLRKQPGQLVNYALGAPSP